MVFGGEDRGDEGVEDMTGGEESGDDEAAGGVLMLARPERDRILGSCGVVMPSRGGLDAGDSAGVVDCVKSLFRFLVGIAWFSNTANSVAWLERRDLREGVGGSDFDSGAGSSWTGTVDGVGGRDGVPYDRDLTSATPLDRVIRRVGSAWFAI